MRKKFAVFLLAVAASSLAAPALADTIPPIGLAPGQPYQLIFVTADYTYPTSGDINTYNEFVQAEAALSSSLPTTTWHAVVSTADVDAGTNAPWLGLPVYNTQGEQVTLNGDSLYVGSVQTPVTANQYGIVENVAVWTGSTQFGTASSEPLGPTIDGGHEMGISHTYGSNWWLAAGVDYTNGLAPLYALSGAINTPEPSAAILLGLGAIGVGTMVLGRGMRKRAA